MNGRELWFSLLQAAIVAPWLWQQADKQNSTYFSMGLRLVGTAVFVANLPPILAGAREVAVQYQQAKTGNGTARAPAQMFRTASVPMVEGNAVTDAATIIPGAF